MGSSDDLIIIAAIGAPIIAYAANIGGFKTWADQQAAAMGGGTTPPPGKPPVVPCVKIGSNCQICRGERTAIWQGICRGQLATTKTAGPYPAGWSDSTACNSIRQIFINKCNAGAGGGAGPTTCPYSGCGNLPTGPSCFQCRCRGICTKHPGTYPVTTADGSCTCRKLAGASQAYEFEEHFNNVTMS